MKILVNKKGMSMAIQIFIVLFVLLAVAMLVLRMVTEQTEQQIRIIGEEQRKAEMKQIQADCQAVCKCESLRTKVGFCLKLIDSPTFGNEKFDFTGDGFADDFAEPAETGGLYGLCEDRVYCSQIFDCKCGDQTLSMKNCFQLAKMLWNQEDAACSTLMQRFFPPATCDMTDDEAMRHWGFVYLQDMVDGCA